MHKKKHLKYITAFNERNRRTGQEIITDWWMLKLPQAKNSHRSTRLVGDYQTNDCEHKNNRL